MRPAAMTISAAIAALALLLLCGCMPYRFAGSTLPPAYRRIAIGQILNATSEPRLDPLVRNALAARLENTPSIDVVSIDNAGLVVELKIESLEQRSLARALMRDTADRKDDGDAYQTVLFRLTAKISHTIILYPGMEEIHGTVTANADVPMMPDHDLPLQAALRQLAADAAEKLAAAITEFNQ